jgi:hypothetical protein
LEVQASSCRIRLIPLRCVENLVGRAGEREASPASAGERETSPASVNPNSERRRA